MLENIATVATIILFVIYFIGRIITIIVEKNNKYENVEIYYDEEDIPADLKIVDEFECDKDSGEIVIITPTTKQYNWLKIYKAEYDEKKNDMKKTEMIYENKKILNGHSIKISATIPDTMPWYIIEFERSDYMKGELPLHMNGKNGIEDEMLEFKHTFRSVLYYLCR